MGLSEIYRTTSNSVLNGNDQLFAAKYLTFMPSQEELRREIEQQKEFFRLQNDKIEL